MKIQIASDLHFEVMRESRFRTLHAAPGADVFVIAGDIGARSSAVEHFRRWPVPVIYVHGNHEMYSGFDYGKTVAEIRARCVGTSVHFLEKDELILDGFPDVRFLGTCMWTDYLLFRREQQEKCMAECEELLQDHSVIKSRDRRFSAEDAMYRHVAAKNWLRVRLDVPFAGKTVVVTHHGCHWNSIAQRWRSHLASAGFASDLTSLLDKTDLWIHGHTHDSFDYRVGRARVVVNPRGYPTTNGFENAAFNDKLVIEP